ncbi:MAG TPA: DEAD/DEAH box helicase, partial [Pirellulales bacterium]
FSQQDALLERLWKQSALPSLDLPPDLSWEQVRPVVKPRLTLEPLGPQNQHELGAVLTFDYDGWLVRATSRETSNVDASGKRVVLRDPVAESTLINELFEAGARQIEVDIFKDFDALAPKKNLGKLVSTLMPRGWHVEAAGKKVRSASLVKINVSTSIDWFELTGTVEFDGATASLPLLLAAIQRGEHFITLDDGSQGMLPEEWINQYAPLAALGDAGNGESVKFISAQAALLDALLQAEDNVDVDEAFLRIRDKLRSFSGIHPRPEPDGFKGTLRSYQRDGLGWLHFLDEFGFGGCLADDMGLGKTIQVLARLAELYYRPGMELEAVPLAGSAATNGEAATNGDGETHAKSSRNGAAADEDVVSVDDVDDLDELEDSPEAEIGEALESSAERESHAEEVATILGTTKSRTAVATTTAAPAPAMPERPADARRPTLVIVPRSLIQNWVEEARKFTPQLRVLDYTGTHRKDHRKTLSNYDIIVTTYGTLRRDAPGLRKQQFDYVILDEAQAIKNQDSQAAKACRLMQGRRRLAMTGTPVENHLGELWSLFEFLNPGMLGRSATFKMFSGSGRPTDQNTLNLLVRALKPFLLRRTKEQVLTELPPKTEQTVYCELGKRQRALYDELREHYRAELGKRIESHGLKQSKIQVLEALLRLRQAACHPGLLSAKHMDVPSAKLDTLIEQLMEVLAENHKALVFSQFTSLLAIVRKRLEEAGIVYEYLDGRTRDRQARVDRFQKDEACPVFLISLRAGGLGLNLTSADYVFILDPWWNPAVEAQAVDRAHRIGQNRRVFAYRLIAKNTVEEKILLLQNEKRDLADAVVAADQRVLTGLTAEDLQLLLS